MNFRIKFILPPLPFHQRTVYGQIPSRTYPSRTYPSHHLSPSLVLPPLTYPLTVILKSVRNAHARIISVCLRYRRLLFAPKYKTFFHWATEKIFYIFISLLSLQQHII